MESSSREMKSRIWVATAVVLATLLSSCSTVGPAMIRSGRPAYNDAILKTSDEQLLQNIVRLRFVDSLGFLTVSSITANVSLGGTAGVNVPFGGADSYATNLVPFSATVTTEQNPTITYTPVPGGRMLRQLTDETPVDLVIQLMNATQNYKAVWQTLVRRINDIRNPDFIEQPRTAVDPRFAQFVELADDLQQRGVLYWVRRPGVEGGAAMVLRGHARASSGEVMRILEYLGITNPVREGDAAIVPIQISTAPPQQGVIPIETRSLFSLMQLAAASIDLPADVAATARQYPERGFAGRDVRILSDASQPAQARVAVEHRGRWYYIDDTDQRSKAWFQLLQLLASSEVSDTPSAPGPILTLPAGKR